jgi:hypothetical protein
MGENVGGLGLTSLNYRQLLPVFLQSEIFIIDRLSSGLEAPQQAILKKPAMQDFLKFDAP